MVEFLYVVVMAMAVLSLCFALSTLIAEGKNAGIIQER